MIIEEKNKHSLNILNKKGAKKLLSSLKFPIYFLDFEVITNNKEWMFQNNLSLDQQISSFSILKIESLKDEETNIKHFNLIGKNEDYKLMAKKLTAFYKELKAPVVVWGQDLELRAITKLLKSSNKNYHKKLSCILSNLFDLRQLFHSGSFLKLEPYGKSSLNYVAKAFDVYKKTSIKNGKEAHFILESTITNKKINKNQLKSISKKIEEYNNSDVINIKRVLAKLLIFLKISNEF